jgi:LacI family transcriptional regulator
VLNDRSNVAPQTIIMVQTAIDELGYQPNSAAQILASNRTYTIGIIVDEISGEYFLPMLRGFEIATAEAGYNFVITSTRRRSKRGRQLVGEGNTDGLIVFADSLPDSELYRYSDMDFPLVLLHRSPPPNTKIPYVTIENKAGAFEMLDYLVSARAYKNFAFLRGSEGHEDTIWREKGYREALSKHGMNYDEQLLGNGSFDEAVAYETVTQWMRRKLSMDVIVAFDDDSAIGAIAALKEANMRVPDDIAVVGFDDIRLSSYLDPALTTVRVPIEKVAQASILRLVELIETGETEAETLLSTELIIRRSCGCC